MMKHYQITIRVNLERQIKLSRDHPGEMFFTMNLCRSSGIYLLFHLDRFVDNSFQRKGGGNETLARKF